MTLERLTPEECAQNDRAIDAVMWWLVVIVYSFLVGYNVVIWWLLR